jgi:hypothetical protein
MRYDEKQVKEIAQRVAKTFDKRGYKLESTDSFRSYSDITLNFEKQGVTGIGVTVTREGKYKFNGTRRNSDGTNNLYIVLERTEEYVNRQVSKLAEQKDNKVKAAKIKAEMITLFGEPKSKDDGSDGYGEYSISYGPVSVEGKINDKGEIEFTLGLNTRYNREVKATNEQIKQTIAIFNK